MQIVRLANLDRPGLPAALAVRGIVAQQGAIDAARVAHGLVLGWKLAAGSLGERLMSERARQTGPLMVVLDDVAEAAMIVALDAGADDALPHSTSDAMIAARLTAMLRRGAVIGVIAIGDLRIDTIARSAARAGQSLDLLPREYRLLRELAAQGGAIVSRMALFSRVWGLSFDPGTNVLEVHVSRLRAKLDRGFASPMLLTEKGRGYRLIAAG